MIFEQQGKERLSGILILLLLSLLISRWAWADTTDTTGPIRAQIEGNKQNINNLEAQRAGVEEQRQQEGDPERKKELGQKLEYLNSEIGQLQASNANLTTALQGRLDFDNAPSAVQQGAPPDPGASSDPPQYYRYSPDGKELSQQGTMENPYSSKVYREDPTNPNNVGSIFQDGRGNLMEVTKPGDWKLVDPNEITVNYSDGSSQKFQQFDAKDLKDRGTSGPGDTYNLYRNVDDPSQMLAERPNGEITDLKIRTDPATGKDIYSLGYGTPDANGKVNASWGQVEEDSIRITSLTNGFVNNGPGTGGTVYNPPAGFGPNTRVPNPLLDIRGPIQLGGSSTLYYPNRRLLNSQTRQQTRIEP